MIPGLGLEHIDPVVTNKIADRAFRVIQITKDSRAHGAHLYAGRLQALGNAVVTPRAFISDIFFVVKKSRAVGASLNTVLTTDAILMINKHYAVFGLVGCAHWTDLYTRRFLAMVAHFRHKECLLNLCVLVAIIKAIFLRTRDSDVFRITLAVYVWFLLTLQIHITFNPRAKVMSIPGNVIFDFARLYALEASNTAGGINPVSPTVLAPIIICRAE